MKKEEMTTLENTSQLAKKAVFIVLINETKFRDSNVNVLIPQFNEHFGM